MSSNKSKRGRRGRASSKQKVTPPISKEGSTTTGRARPGDFDKQVKKIRADMVDIRANLSNAEQILKGHELSKADNESKDEVPSLDLKGNPSAAAGQEQPTENAANEAEKGETELLSENKSEK